MTAPSEAEERQTDWASVLPNPFLVAERPSSREPDEDLVFAFAINQTLEAVPPADPGSRQDASDALSNRVAASPRGVALLGIVFDELSAQLGDEFSSAELMKAAQLLIDVSSAEYVSNPYKDPVDRAGYFSWDLVRAFKSPWHVSEVETYRLEHCDLDELSLETIENARLLQQGWHEHKWEF